MFEQEIENLKFVEGFLNHEFYFSPGIIDCWEAKIEDEHFWIIMEKVSETIKMLEVKEGEVKWNILNKWKKELVTYTKE